MTRSTYARPSMGTAKPKHALKSRADEKVTRTSEAKAHERKVHRQIDERDKQRCRAYGTRLSPNGGLLNGIHRHHIVFRSQGGETSTANMCDLGPQAHADVHAGRLRITGNANRALTCTNLVTGKRWISLPPGVVMKLEAVGA